MAAPLDLPDGFVNRFMFCHARASKFNYETEELCDYFIHRRLAAVCVGFMGALDMPWLFTPNRITFGSLGMGLLSAYYMYNGELLIAAWCELACITLDCCDGQLARMYGNGSLVGRVLDGIVDMTVALTLGVMWVLTLVETGFFSSFVGWSIMALSTVTFQQQAMMYDRVKNIYSLKTTPLKDQKAKVVGLEEMTVVDREADEAWRTHSYPSWLLLVWYKHQYLAVQNKVAAKSIESTLQEGEADTVDPDEYKAKWRSTMRLASWIGTGTHAFLFYALLFLAHFTGNTNSIAMWFFVNNVVLFAVWLVCWDRVQRM